MTDSETLERKLKQVSELLKQPCSTAEQACTEIDGILDWLQHRDFKGYVQQNLAMFKDMLRSTKSPGTVLTLRTDSTDSAMLELWMAIRGRLSPAGKFD